MKESVIQASTAAADPVRSGPRRLYLPAVDINRVGAGLVVGAIAGMIIGGIGARVAMRVVALLGEGQPSFSVAGTLPILIMGAVLGAVGGLGFVLLRWALRMAAGEETSPLRSLAAGAVYGGVLAALVALPFFLAPAGELSLAPPLVGAALFSWIPLAYGLALGITLPWLERRTVAAPRDVGLGWLSVYSLALVLALAGMAPLLGEFVPFPPAATQLHYDLGLSFAAAQTLHRWLALAFVLIYCGLTTLLFWRGSHHMVARLAAVTLLLCAAGFFGRQPALAGGMNALPVVRLLPALLQAAGLSLLLILMVVIPDGRFALRWTRAVAVAWCLWSLLWFANPLPGTALDVSAWPEPLLVVALAAGLGSGLAALGWRARQGEAEQRRQMRPVFVGFAVALISFLLLWLASLSAPDLRLRVLPLPRALLAFGPYLLPWLALPLSLLVATLRGLWSVTRNP
ncbi:MAG TPA: hypothetical protein VL334_04425 [Anaerolineae bacterium]|nr:hypothetical protein [Anaerolineae bacterium]